ncbi:MAG: hypothetical protein NDJ89_14780 [Oligoflexia bacterium]|nr:hypothetical protein [Oligoflexia bacterium]
MTPRTFALTVLTLVFSLSGFCCLYPRAAFSAGEAGAAAALFRLEARNEAARIVRVRGTLSCALSAENDGNACELRLRSAENERDYALTGNQARAMELFHAGTRDVAIEGVLQGNGAIAISRAESL